MVSQNQQIEDAVDSTANTAHPFNTRNVFGILSVDMAQGVSNVNWYLVLLLIYRYQLPRLHIVVHIVYHRLINHPLQKDITHPTIMLQPAQPTDFISSFLPSELQSPCSHSCCDGGCTRCAILILVNRFSALEGPISGNV